MNSDFEKIKKEYQRRDKVYIHEEWGKNPYHPRHPMGSLYHKHNAEILRKILNNLNIDLRKLKVLDIGCGYGYWLRHLVEFGAQPCNLYGIDISAERIQIAQKMNPAINWLQVEEPPYPFKDQQFDIILQINVISSIPNQQLVKNITNEILRLKTSDGMIFWLDNVFSLNKKVQCYRLAQIQKFFPDLSVIFKKSAYPLIYRKLNKEWRGLAETLVNLHLSPYEAKFFIFK